MFGFKRFFDPALFARTYRDPISWASLAIDLFPLIAVMFLGWGGVALVMLYWLENIIVGATAIARMLGKAILPRGQNVGVVIAETIGALFLSAFFLFHYGMFTFIHGLFLQEFAKERHPDLFSRDVVGPMDAVINALSVAPGMMTYFALLGAWALFLFLWDFVRGGEYHDSEIPTEMVRPYGRVIVLHIGIFAAAAAMAVWGEPMWGVLALIALRAVWGVFYAMGRKRQQET